MSGFLLLRPLWLAALLPLALAVLWVRRRAGQGEWSALVDPALLPALQRLGLLQGAGRNAHALLPFAAAAVLAMALSGPAVPRPGTTAFRAQDPLVLVLDLSPSIVADDRILADLQAGAAGLLDGAGGRPVGMMLYAADAYLASAPTTDTEALLSLIGVLEKGTVPVAGSRPDIALSMARDLFADAEGPGLGGADLVLLTDGGGAGPRAEEEAARLAHDGARVWALALPAAPGSPAPDLAGLAALARAGGGEVLPVAEAAALSDRIARARTARLVREDTAGQGVRELGPWLVPLALLALFPLFRRRR